MVIPNSNNLTNKNWILGIVDDDAILPIPLDASEGGLFTGHFVPPPPRPLFLDEGVTPDGLTTCDLCTWAWQNGNTHPADAKLEAPGELGWVLTLVIVSLASAVIGAIIMIVFLHCKRIKTPVSNRQLQRSPPQNTRLHLDRPPISTPDDKTVVSTITPPNFPSSQHNINGVWSWLSRRSAATPSQLENPPTNFVENHYTHMEDAYNSVGDALYAELDVESSVDRDSNSPAYQNSAYTDPDAPTSSAPSSAYYSDLSVTTMPDRAYEVVGLATMPTWDPEGRKQGSTRLAAISENVTVPSDYV